MNNTAYVFTSSAGKVISYPGDYTTEVISKLCSKVKCRHQLCMHRNGNLMYYGYIWRLPKPEQFIGMCFVVNDAYMVDNTELMTAFDAILKMWLVICSPLNNAKGDKVALAEQWMPTEAQLELLASHLREKVEIMKAKSHLPAPSYGATSDSAYYTQTDANYLTPEKYTINEYTFVEVQTPPSLQTLEEAKVVKVSSEGQSSKAGIVILISLAALIICIVLHHQLFGNQTTTADRKNTEVNVAASTQVPPKAEPTFGPRIIYANDTKNNFYEEEPFSAPTIAKGAYYSVVAPVVTGADKVKNIMASLVNSQGILQSNCNVSINSEGKLHVQSLQKLILANGRYKFQLYYDNRAINAYWFSVVMPDNCSSSTSTSSSANPTTTQPKASANSNQSSYSSPSSSMSIDISNPKYQSTPKENIGLRIKRVQVTSTQTIIDMEFDNRNENSCQCNIDPNTYIRNFYSDKKYKLIKAEGIPLSPKWHNFSSRYETLKFRLIFPPLPSGTTRFNFIENITSPWQFYGVELK